MSERWPSDPGPRPPLAPGAGFPAPGAPPPTPAPPDPWGPSGPFGPGGSEDEPDLPRRGRPRWFVVVGLVAVAALLLAAVGRGLFVGPAEERGEPTRAAPSDPAPGSPAPTGDVDAQIQELIAFVEAERGLTFRDEVEVELVDDDEFRRRLLDGADEDLEDLAAVGRSLEALELLPAGTDLFEALEDLLGEGVVGFYDPETGELVVRGTELTPYVGVVVVHELTHALDDQWFDLDRPELEDRDDEASFALSALAEGTALLVEDRYRASLDADDRRAARAEEFELGMAMDISGIPFIVLELIVAPYELGRPFAEELVASGGMAALDAAYEDPPTTSKEILDPALYLEDFEPVGVEEPPVEGEVIDGGVFGQFLLELMLRRELSSSQARGLGSSWLGDRYVTWESGQRACLRLDVATAPGDRDDLAAGLEEVAASMADAEVSTPDPDRVRFTSCA